MTKIFITVALIPVVLLVLVMGADYMGAGRSLERGACGSFVDCMWLGSARVRVEMNGLGEATNGVLTGHAAGYLVGRSVPVAAMFVLFAVLAYTRCVKTLRLLLGFLVLATLIPTPSILGPAGVAVLVLLLLLSFFLKSNKRPAKNAREAEAAREPAPSFDAQAIERRGN